MTVREINFRVWDPVYKSWLKEDDYLISDDGAVLDVFIKGLNAEILDMNEYAVIEQNTGLKDKNGVPIYEGDIVRQQMRFDETNGVIFWQEEKSRFAINLDGFITTITKPQENSYEVVGNIHENPELLEETK